MKKTTFIDRAVKAAVSTNGEPEPNLQVRVDVIPNGAHLHVTMPDGAYVGLLTYHASEGSEPLLAAAFANWLAALDKRREEAAEAANG